MNANELADLIGMCGDGGYNQDAAKMLRLQQSEIEALKQIIDANNLNQNIGQFVKPTNEPVAYGRYIENAKMWLVVELDADMPEGYIPLYTHPVKEQLTDEKILNLWWDSDHTKDEDDLILTFAKTILKEG